MGSKNGDEDGDTRHRLTFVIISIAMVAIAALCIVVIAVDVAARAEHVRLVFGSVLPLFGTWVGTVLAYYYSRENLTAATQSVGNLAKQMTAAGPSASIPVKNVMHSLSEIDQLPDSLCKPIAKLADSLIKDIIEAVEKKKRHRVPVFDENGVAKYMIHTSSLHAFVSRRAMANQSTEGLKLKDLFAEMPDVKTLFESSFGVVSASATLADVLAELQKSPTYFDVFVTSSGNRSEPVMGWVTDKDVRDYSAT
jgi:hypothetical protein